MNMITNNELIKCFRDPKYFIENYFKIQHPVKGLPSIELNETQTKLLTELESNEFIIDTNDDRQMGATTIYCAYLLWLCCFCRNTIASIADVKYSTTQRNMVAVGYTHLPDFLKPKTVREDKRLIEFDNGSKIIFSNSNPCTLLAQGLSFLVLDNFQFYTLERQKEWKYFARVHIIT